MTATWWLKNNLENGPVMCCLTKNGSANIHRHVHVTTCAFKVQHYHLLASGCVVCRTAEGYRGNWNFTDSTSSSHWGRLHKQPPSSCESQNNPVMSQQHAIVCHTFAM